jgi:hypothetical protein
VCVCVCVCQEGTSLASIGNHEPALPTVGIFFALASRAGSCALKGNDTHSLTQLTCSSVWLSGRHACLDRDCDSSVLRVAAHAAAGIGAHRRGATLFAPAEERGLLLLLLSRLVIAKSLAALLLLLSCLSHSEVVGFSAAASELSVS